MRPRVAWTHERCFLLAQAPRMPSAGPTGGRGAAPLRQRTERLRPCAASTLESSERAAPRRSSFSSEKQQFEAAAEALQARLAKALDEEDAAAQRILKRLYAGSATKRLVNDGEVLLGLVGRPVLDMQTGQDRIVNVGSYLWEFSYPQFAREERGQQKEESTAGVEQDAAGQEAAAADAAAAAAPAAAPAGSAAAVKDSSPSSPAGSAEGGDPAGDAGGGDPAGEDEEARAAAARAEAEGRRREKAEAFSPYRKFKRGDGVVLHSGAKPPDPSQLGQLTGTVFTLPHSRPCIQISVTQAMHDTLSARRAAALDAGRPLFWRVDKYQPDATLTRQIEAVSALTTPWGLREAERTTRASRRRRHVDLDLSQEAEARFTPGEERVRSVILGHPQAASMAAAPNKWARNPAWREVVRAGLQRMRANKDLNQSQLEAIAAAAQATFTLWQGPPGTGKTKTLLGLLSLLCEAQRAAGPASALAPEDHGPILACADTNAASDNLLEGLHARGINVIRLGIQEKVRAGLAERTLVHLVEQDPDYKEVLRVQQAGLKKRAQAAPGEPVERAMVEAKTYRALAPRGHEAGGRDGPPLYHRANREPLIDPKEIEWIRDALRSEADLLLSEAGDMADRIGKKLLRRAQVVVMTCSGAGDHFRLAGLRFRAVIIDEATQATEPSVLVPILLRGAEMVVLAGDPRQLPPTVLSQAAVQYRLNESLFERVHHSERFPGGLKPLLLDTQYRMHTSIAAFPSLAFYGERLRSDITTKTRQLPAGFPWPNPRCHVALVDTPRGVEEGMVDRHGAVAVRARRGYFNEVEARLAVGVLQRLLAAGEELSIALLTPYRGQVRLLDRLLRQRGLTRKAEVSTIDGYQGREADVIILSTVRAGERLGFLADERRLNVAITRPKRGLVVVGKARTLVLGRVLRAWVEWCERNRCLLTPADLGLEEGSKEPERYSSVAAPQQQQRGPVGSALRQAQQGQRWSGPARRQQQQQQQQEPEAFPPPADDWSMSGPQLRTYSRYDDAEEEAPPDWDAGLPLGDEDEEGADDAGPGWGQESGGADDDDDGADLPHNSWGGKGLRRR